MAAQEVQLPTALQVLQTSPAAASRSIPLKIYAHAVEPDNQARMLYDRRGAARQLSISIRSLDYYIAHKQISTRRVGRKVMISHGELVRFSRADHFGAVDAQD